MFGGSSESTCGDGRLKRLALLTDGIFPYVVGGIQRHSRLLAEHLAAAGVHVTVFHTAYTAESTGQARSGTGLPANLWQHIDVRFVEYPRPGRYPGHYVRDCWRYSAALLDAFTANPPAVDFVYAQGLTGLAFVAARKRGEPLPPVGVNAHGYEMFQKPSSFRSLLEQLLLRPTFAALARDADAVFTFPGKIRDIVQARLGVPESRLYEVPNGLDETWIVAEPRACRRPRRFVFVGRHDRRKGLPELLAAIRLLPAGIAEFHFVGPLPLGVLPDAGNIVPHGSLTDATSLQAVLDASDVLLCPSHSEGMPTVILEALARGLAVIATDVGAVRAMVDESNGIVLERPTPEAIANAIRRLCDAPDDILHGMKRASLTKAPRFGWTAVAAGTIAAIERSIHQRRGPSLRRSG